MAKMENILPGPAETSIQYFYNEFSTENSFNFKYTVQIKCILFQMNQFNTVNK